MDFRQEQVQSNFFPLALMTTTTAGPRKCVPPASLVLEHAATIWEEIPVCSTSNCAAVLLRASSDNKNHSSLSLPRCYDPPRKRQKLETMTIAKEPSRVTSHDLPPRKRPLRERRVQIHPTTTFHEPPVEHETVLVENKRDLWYSQEDFNSTLLNMRKAIRTAKRLQNNKNQIGIEEDEGEEHYAVASALPVYGESLACTYLACCADTNSGTTSFPPSINQVHLEHLGASSSDVVLRGMETAALPNLAAERSQKRREIIQNVILVHKSLAPQHHHQRADCVRNLSEQWTAPSRKFAQAMGLSDTYSALRTYAEDATVNTPIRQPAAKGA